MAIRLSGYYHIPLVFTHHILLNQYADFFPIHNEGVKRFVLKLATGYANLTDGVVAPSQAVGDILKRDGVVKPIHIIPTGVDIERFANGKGQNFRKQWKIPQDAFVVGCVCRLNPEKNLEFLARAACLFLKQNHKAHCLIVGEGSVKDAIINIFKEFGLKERLRCTGTLQGQDLVNSYHAMDVFMFSSHSETQGIVLIESMACGTPVAALDAPAAREIIKDHRNGRLVTLEDEEEFALTLAGFSQLSKHELRDIRINARMTANEFSIERCAARLLNIYQNLRSKNINSGRENHIWDSLKDCLKVEKDLLKNAIEATEAALKKDQNLPSNFSLFDQPRA